jgi:hypothetical protein
MIAANTETQENYYIFNEKYIGLKRGTNESDKYYQDLLLRIFTECFPECQKM